MSTAHEPEETAGQGSEQAQASKPVGVQRDQREIEGNRGEDQKLSIRLGEWMGRIERAVSGLVRLNGKVIRSNKKILLERRKECLDCIAWYQDSLAKIDKQIAEVEESEREFFGLQEQFEREGNDLGNGS